MNYVDTLITRTSPDKLPQTLAEVKDILASERHLVVTPATEKYLNPHTDWRDQPRLYFGIGGGSQHLTQGLPVDVLGLLFAGEILKRRLGLMECRVLIADVITKTNPFPAPQIDRVLRGEKRMMQYLIDKCGFANWSVTLHSDLHDEHRHAAYLDFLARADQAMDAAIANSPFMELGKDARGHSDNHHFALESALTHYLVGNGIHLGWYIPGPDIRSQAQVTHLIARYGKTALKRMDEEPFDSYYIELMRLLGEVDRITPVYVKAGVRLGKQNGVVERVPPYIAYDPERRILLVDDQAVVGKLRDAEGRLTIPKRGVARDYFADLTRMAHQLQLPVEGKDFVDRLRALLCFLNQDGTLKTIYHHTFAVD